MAAEGQAAPPAWEGIEDDEDLVPSEPVIAASAAPPPEPEPERASVAVPGGRLLRDLVPEPTAKEGTALKNQFVEEDINAEAPPKEEPTGAKLERLENERKAKASSSGETWPGAAKAEEKPAKAPEAIPPAAQVTPRTAAFDVYDKKPVPSEVERMSPSEERRVVAAIAVSQEQERARAPKADVNDAGNVILAKLKAKHEAAFAELKAKTVAAVEAEKERYQKAADALRAEFLAQVDAHERAFEQLAAAHKAKYLADVEKLEALVALAG